MTNTPMSHLWQELEQLWQGHNLPISELATLRETYNARVQEYQKSLVANRRQEQAAILAELNVESK
jgi:hypothetical protein